MKFLSDLASICRENVSQLRRLCRAKSNVKNLFRFVEYKMLTLSKISCNVMKKGIAITNTFMGKYQ